MRFNVVVYGMFCFVLLLLIAVQAYWSSLLHVKASVYPPKAVLPPHILVDGLVESVFAGNIFDPQRRLLKGDEKVAVKASDSKSIKHDPKWSLLGIGRGNDKSMIYLMYKNGAGQLSIRTFSEGDELPGGDKLRHIMNDSIEVETVNGIEDRKMFGLKP